MTRFSPFWRDVYVGTLAIVVFQLCTSMEVLETFRLSIIGLQLVIVLAQYGVMITSDSWNGTEF